MNDNLDLLKQEVAQRVNGDLADIERFKLFDEQWRQICRVRQSGGEWHKPAVTFGEQLAELDETIEPPVKLLTYDELLTLPAKEWLVENIIARRDLGMLFGEAGSGKTFVVIDLVIDAVTGTRWANRFDVTWPLDVVYCAGEGVTGLKARFEAAAVYRGKAGSDLAGLTVITDVPQLFDDNYPTAARKFAASLKQRSRPVDLLIIDTLHAATVGADENSSKDAGKILASLKHIAKELNCAVLVVHHTNKAKSGERGSSAFRGAMDVMLEVTQAGTRHILNCSKLKDGEQFEAQTFAFESVMFSVLPIWQGKDTGAGISKTERKRQILDVLGQYKDRAFTAKKLSEATGISPNYANTLLGELVQKGQIARQLEDESKNSSNRNPWVYKILE